MLCKIGDDCLIMLGECICRNITDSLLIRVKSFERCRALSPALTNGWSRIAHKQVLERYLGLIVFGKIRGVCSSVALEGSSVKTCTAGY